MAGVYDLGDVVALTAAFTNSGGTAVTPSSGVTITVKLPDGTTTSPATPSNPSTGNYSYEYAPTQEGLHFYRFVGTGTNAGAGEGKFTVRKSKVI